MTPREPSPVFSAADLMAELRAPVGPFQQHIRDLLQQPLPPRLQLAPEPVDLPSDSVDRGSDVRHRVLESGHPLRDTAGTGEVVAAELDEEGAHERVTVTVHRGSLTRVTVEVKASA